MKVRKTSRWRSMNEVSKSWAEYHKKLMKELADEMDKKIKNYAEKNSGNTQ